jgi:hypothetical protein
MDTPPGYEAVRPGQHYVFRTGRRATLDEAIVAAGADGLTLRLVATDEAGRARPPVTQTIPYDVLRIMRTHRPEIPVWSYGTSGYDAAYFRAWGAGQPAERTAATHERVVRTIGGRRFAAVATHGEVLARTTKGCIQMTWRDVRTDVYPFMLEQANNDVPVLQLTAIR